MSGLQFIDLPLFKTASNFTLTALRQYFLAPKVVITPSYNYFRSPEVAWRSLISRSIFVEATSEQYFSPLFNDEKLTQYPTSLCLKQQFFLCGSEYYAKKLVEYAQVDREKIYIVGSLKVDLAKKNGTNSECKNSKHILFVSDYSLGSWGESERAHYKKYYGVTISCSDSELVAKERDNAIKIALKISKLLNFSVTFRLHPGESYEPYRCLEGSDVHLSLGGDPLMEDVFKSDLVVGYTTTSIFEILASGCPFLSLHEEDYPRIQFREFLQECIHVDSSNIENIINQTLAEGISLGEEWDWFSSGISDIEGASLAKHLSAINKIKKYDPLRCKLSKRMHIKFVFINLLAICGRVALSVPLLSDFLKRMFGSRTNNISSNSSNYTPEDIEKLVDQDVSVVELTQWRLGSYGWICNSRLKTDD